MPATKSTLVTVSSVVMYVGYMLRVVVERCVFG